MAIFGKIFGRFASRRVLGLDIGSDAARLAMVRREGDALHLDWVEEVSLREMQGFTDYESVLEKLTPILRERGVRNVEVAADPPWNSARVVLEEMPYMSNERFYKAAEFYFQQKDNEALLDPLHHAIPQPPRTTPDSGQAIDGLMVSMDRVMVRGLDDMCGKLDVKLSWIAAQPLCYQQLLKSAGAADKNLFVADIGASQTRLYLMVRGSVLLVRRLKPCANDILKALGDEFDLSWEQAADVLIGHSGVGPLAAADPEGLLAKTRATVERQFDELTRHLADEVQRSSAYVATRHQVDVDGILVCGGLVESADLLELLDKRIHLPLSQLNALAGLTTECEIPDKARARFSLAIGAALQCLGAPDEHNILMAGKIELADPEGRSSRWDGVRRYALAAGAASVVLGVGTYEGIVASRMKSAQQSIERLQDLLNQAQDYAETLGYNRELFALDGKISALRDLYSARQIHTPFIGRLVSMLPPDTWLTELTIEQGAASSTEETREEEADARNRDDRVGDLVDQAYGPTAVAGSTGLELRLTGRATRVESVGELVLALEKDGLVTGIRTLHVFDEAIGEAHDGNSQHVFRFTLSGQPNLRLSPETALKVGEPAR